MREMWKRLELLNNIFKIQNVGFLNASLSLHLPCFPEIQQG
jgi:hypothetical protein